MTMALANGFEHLSSDGILRLALRASERTPVGCRTATAAMQSTHAIKCAKGQSQLPHAEKPVFSLGQPQLRHVFYRFELWTIPTISTDEWSLLGT